MSHRNTLKAEIDRIVENWANQLTQLSDRIWDNPELAFSERMAAAAQIELLQEAGFHVRKDLAGLPTAFVAEFGEAGPVAGFLGEFDALDGLSQAAGVAAPKAIQIGAAGHGCGHNLLGVGSIGAALAVKEYLERHNLPGRVRYFGCPAEEGGAGKVFMAREGAFQGLDFVLTWHPGPAAGLKSYSALAMLTADFSFLGNASHASWAPHLGRSALDAMTLMHTGINFLREHMLVGDRVHYAILDGGGTAANIVHPTASTSVYIRSADLQGARALFERVINIAEGAALMTETKMKHTFRSGYSNYVLNDPLETVMHEALEEVGPVPFSDEDQVAAEPFSATLTQADKDFFASNFGAFPDKPLLSELMPKARQNFSGTSDVGDVSWIAPTGQFWGACYVAGTNFHSWQLTAQGKSSAAHKGMLHISKAMALSAIRLLLEPAALQAVQDVFREETRGRAYVSPLPQTLRPEVLEQRLG